MKTKKTFRVIVTRNEYRTSSSNLVKHVAEQSFKSREKAEEWIEETAKEYQAKEIEAQTCENEGMLQEMIDEAFSLETYGNKTYAPFNNGASRKGYYQFEIR